MHQGTAAGNAALIGQIKQRFLDFKSVENISPERVFAVGCDGASILYMRFRGGKFELESPQPVNSQTIQRLLRALISLGAQGKSFKPDILAEDFGSDNVVVIDSIRNLLEVINETKSRKTRTFFQQWKILFGEVCGYNIEVANDKISTLGQHYGVPDDFAPAELLFAVHSYYAIFIKLLAAEIVSAFSQSGKKKRWQRWSTRGVTHPRSPARLVSHEIRHLREKRIQKSPRALPELRFHPSPQTSTPATGPAPRTPIRNVTCLILKRRMPPHFHIAGGTLPTETTETPPTAPPHPPNRPRDTSDRSNHPSAPCRRTRRPSAGFHPRHRLPSLRIQSCGGPLRGFPTKAQARFPRDMPIARNWPSVTALDHCS